MFKNSLTLKRFKFKREGCVLQRVLQCWLSPHKPCSYYFYFGICHLQVREEAKQYSPKSRKMGQRSPTPSYFNLWSTMLLKCSSVLLGKECRLSPTFNPLTTFSQLVLGLELATFCPWACFCKQQFTASSRASCDPAAIPKRSPGLSQRDMGTQALYLTW